MVASRTMASVPSATVCCPALWLRSVADGPGIRVVPVRRHLLRGTTGEVQGLRKETLGRRHIASLAESRVDQVAVAVDRAIEVAPLAVDLDVRLVHMPLRPALPAPFGAQMRGEQRGEARLPVPDGLMGEAEAPREEHLREGSEAQLVA